jgi:arsenite/tail-anchored protein-transporting ATPase
LPSAFRKPQASGLKPGFVFFGGKGGVGKTTCAAARAVAAAATGARVLIVSTDPAHSLGDALGCRLSSRVTSVTGSRAHAVELDASRVFARWISAHRGALADIIEHGTWLDRDDVEALLGLSIPGVDELVGLLEVVRLASRGGGRTRASQYDLIVVDTAPTGHTLRLLNAPATVATVAEALDALQEGHRQIREQFARATRPEVADRLIALLANQAAETRALLRDARRVAFQLVTLPEELSLAESIDALAELSRAGIAVTDVIVNRAIPPGPPCPLCDRRRADQRHTIKRIRRRLGGRRSVRIIPAEIAEPRGVKELARFGRRLMRTLPITEDTKNPIGAEVRTLHVPRRGARGSRFAGFDVFHGARLLFFGGKGGVGKTTVAAATALRLARANRKCRVLLLSTDPAPSLADVFHTRIDNRARRVAQAPSNLDVRELDAPALFLARRVAFQAACDEIASVFGAGNLAVSTPGPGVRQLMDLAPPGIDELFGILSVIEARDRYDLIVVDTAPTGHALRLLETPDAAREWVQMLMRMLLKYKSLVRPGQLATELVEVSKSIRELQTILRDPRESRFIVVTRAASVPREETERLLTRLHRLRLATPALVVNAMTLAPSRCPRCRATAAAEQRELALLRGSKGGPSRECAIIQTPLTAPPPRGAVALEGWAGSWI